jgi:hypothetical protein
MRSGLISLLRLEQLGRRDVEPAALVNRGAEGNRAHGFRSPTSRIAWPPLRLTDRPWPDPAGS